MYVTPATQTSTVTMPTPTTKKVSFATKFVDDDHFISYSDSEQQQRRVGDAVGVDVGFVKRHKWKNKSFFRSDVSTMFSTSAMP